MTALFAMHYRSSMAAMMLLLGFVSAFLAITGAQSIGVCYGRDGNNLPSPAQVVSLYQSNQIGRMRIYDPAPEVLQALRGSNIELLLGVPNPSLQGLASDAAAATAWVQTNVRDYLPDVKIKYIAVGNEVSPANQATSQYADFVLPAMQNIQTAISAAGLQDQIKVSTAFDTSIIANPFPPSMSTFGDNVMRFVEPIVGFLVNNRSPLLVNVYPYFSLLGSSDITLQYALFTKPEPEFTDNNLQYQNLFDAILDGVYAALEKSGGSSLEIVVSESGWPSAENREATIENAQTYNQNLIQHVRSGTPKKPNPIETYIFAMFNENLKEPAYEKNFGLFFPDQRPVYPINFT